MESLLQMVMNICKKHFEVVKAEASWQVPIDDLIESLNYENSFFFENKDIYMAEIIKHTP